MWIPSPEIEKQNVDLRFFPTNIFNLKIKISTRLGSARPGSARLGTHIFVSSPPGRDKSPQKSWPSGPGYMFTLKKNRPSGPGYITKKRMSLRAGIFLLKKAGPPGWDRLPKKKKTLRAGIYFLKKESALRAGINYQT